MLSITFKMSDLLRALKSLDPYKRPRSLWKSLYFVEEGREAESDYYQLEQYELIQITPVDNTEGCMVKFACYNQLYKTQIMLKPQTMLTPSRPYARPFWVNYWALFEFAQQYKSWGELTISEVEGHNQFMAGPGLASERPRHADRLTWPVFAATEPGLTIELGDLLDGLRCVIGAAATDITRPVLHSVLFEITNGKAQLTATDGHVLSTYQIASEDAQRWAKIRPVLTGNHKLIVPLGAAQAVYKFCERWAGVKAKKARAAGQLALTENPVEILLSPDLEDVAFLFHEYRVKFWVKLVEGNYPDYKGMGKSIIGRMSFDPAQVAASLERYNLNQAVCITWRPNDFKTLQIAQYAKQCPDLRFEDVRSAWGLWVREVTEEGKPGEWKKAPFEFRFDEGRLITWAIDGRLLLAACRTFPKGTKTAMLEIPAPYELPAWDKEGKRVEHSGKFDSWATSPLTLRAFGPQYSGTYHLIVPMSFVEFLP